MSFGAPHASDEDIVLVRDLYRRLVERVGEPDCRALSAGEQALLALMTAAEEIGAGGFEQFFSMSPELAAAAAGSAKLVKARKLQTVFERANAVAFDEPPRKRGHSEYRRMIRAVETESDRLAELDAEFDALMADPATRIEAFVVRYVEAAPLEFADLET